MGKRYWSCCWFRPSHSSRGLARCDIVVWRADVLSHRDKPDKDGGLNIGNKVTDDLKYLVKMNRVTGVHVTVSWDLSPGWSAHTCYQFWGFY
jgi:hypothetical protein